MTNYRLLLLLLLLSGWSPWIFAHRRTFDVFEFTAKVYNLSIVENIRGKDVYAVSNSPIRVGVPLPDRFSNVEFRIVEGERALFDAETRIVGNFAFLMLKFRRNNILNRELRDKYEFLIKANCKRRDPPDLETMATVNVLVVDQNDAHPIFKNNDYSVQVLENIKPMSNIVQVVATDADIGKNGEIYYSLLNNVPEFAVDPVTGWIRNVKILSHGKYELRVLAEDRASRLYKKKGRNSGYRSSLLDLNKAKVMISVLKTESSVPNLKIEQRTVFVSLANVSQTVAIVRCDLQKDEELVLDLVANEHEPYFKLTRDLMSNAWLLETVPGYIPNKNWKAEILAQIHGDSIQTTTTTVNVIVDESRAVKFVDSVFKFNVNESSPIGYIVGKVYAVLKNGIYEDYEKLSYSITSENGTTNIPFVIDEDTGYLHVGDWLDYEATTVYKFSVLAQLKGFDSVNKATVEVFVKDSNDHSPIFAAKWARGEAIAVDAKSPVNTTVVNVEALDADADHNGIVHYMFMDSHNSPFSIDPEKGEIKIRRSLPRDKSSWRIKVRAYDNGWPLSRSSEMMLTLYKNGTKVPPKYWPSISRDPANLNSPIFHQPHETIIVDDDIGVGKIIASINATDADSGYAGVVRLSCMDEFFAIQPFTGKIFVLRNLHKMFYRHNRSTDVIKYKLNIHAYDMGEPSKSSNMTLLINVRSSNNESPHFEKPLYAVTVKENLPVGSEIMVVKAYDADVGDNGKVSYKLADYNYYMEVGQDTGTLRVRQALDYESIKKISFTVEAYDHGKPSKLGVTNISIVLEDVNDNSPQCIFDSQTVQVPEDYPNGALVTCIPAFDADSGDNARINYELLKTNLNAILPFRIQHDTGCIFLDTEEPLDFELNSIYNLTIKLSDNGITPLSGNCNLVIQLIDVNENLHPPSFSDFVYNFTISENQEAGRFVGKLTAEDPEERKPALKYFIVGGDGVGHFTIDAEGVIRTNEILDHEVSGIYWLAVTAEDNAAIPLSSTVHVMISVLNINDNAPIPRRPIYFATVPENSPETFVVQVQGDDKDELDEQDSLSDSGLTYQIAGGDPQSFFHLEAKSGYLLTHQARLLDREKQKEHTIIVKICDSEQLCTRVPVVVRVQDVNDNKPEFLYEQYKFEVLSDTVGVLCRVFAVDLDEGENALLTYSITGDARFSIDNDGYISSNEKLRPEETVTLSVKATEVVAPFSHATTRVTLSAVKKPHITKNKPNRKPIFNNTDSLTKLLVSDDSRVGEAITHIQASDEDGDKIWWTITGGNVNNIFDLRNDTGTLSLSKSLESLNSSINSVKLEVKISDMIDDTFATVVIGVSRNSLKRPRFSASHYKTQVSETTAVGSLIYSLKATVQSSSAPKSRTKRFITYSIKAVESIAAKNKFRIDSKTGDIFLAATLTKNVAREFSMIVCAVNHESGLSKANYAALTISLTNNEDAAPVFLQKNYNVTIFARTPVHSIIGIVHANDVDNGESGSVVYSIVAGNIGGCFEINAETGEIRLSKSLLFNNNNHTVLVIRATDNSVLKLSDKCRMHIYWIQDEMLSPSFQRSLYSAQVSRNMPIGSLVTVVGLRTPVSGFQFFLDSMCNYFYIHPLSGAVYLKIKISAVEKGNYLNCNVFARNVIGEQASTELSVKTANINENAPFFNQTMYIGFVNERQPNGTMVVGRDGKPLIVRAYDFDSGLSGSINYRIISPSEPFFTVDLITGVIRTKCPLDHEKFGSWSFYVRVSDMGTPPLSSSQPALVTVFIDDVNDVAPKFVDREFFFQLSLPTLKGVEIGRVRAYDPDTVGVLQYRIRDGESDLFAINSDNGIVTVNTDDSNLFTAVQYKVIVSVNDGFHEDTATVIITVENFATKKQKFRFALDNYEISLVENVTAAAPQVLATIGVTGLESDEAAIFRILNPHPEFSISAGSGQIIWNGKALDREVTSQIKLLVEASVGAKNVSRIQQVVHVNIEDVNDCSPIFVDLPYFGVIPLDADVGYKILTVKAVDGDEGDNGVVRYLLRARNRFIRLNKYDGRITVSEKLAPSMLYDTFTFIVDAYDQGTPRLLSSTNVTIKVSSSSVVTLTKKVYHVKVLENVALNTALVTVQTISDGGSKIGYLLDGGDFGDEFSMDFKTGILRVRRFLDRERIESYNLKIVALDLSTGNVQTSSFIHIDVLDVNDNPPSFEKSLYQVTLSETEPRGAEVLKVKAADIDSSNEVITYSIPENQNSVFTIDSITGKIFLTGHLDYESRRRHVIRLRATDDSGLYSEAALVVTVKDANDNAPVVMFPKNVFISSDAIVGQYITQIIAYDVDTVASFEGSQKLLFSIIGGDESVINLNNSNGVISLARTLEYRDILKSECVFNISVSDGLYSTTGHFSLGFTLGHRLQSEIKFEKPVYEEKIEENEKIGTVLTKLVAYDGFKFTKYFIGDNNVEVKNWPVRVGESTGVVETNQVFDYEEAKMYQIPLMAEDSIGRRSFATLRLHVTPKNDNIPKFVSTSYEFCSLNNIKDEEPVLTALAVDKDEDDQVKYNLEIDSGLSSYVRIDETSGIISLRRLNRYRGKKFEFFVNATDTANPPHKALAKITICLLDSNTFLPKFSSNQYVFNVAENVQLNSVIGKIMVTKNGMEKTTFMLADENISPDFPFSVDKLNGNIISVAPLNETKKTEWLFMVRAVSKDTPTSGSLALVKIIVNKPLSSMTFVKNRDIMVAENTFIDTYIGVFVAHDFGANSFCGYSLHSTTNDSDFFKIDAETGILSVAKNMDREERDRHHIDVVASCDDGTVISTNVSIIVLDVNDMAPEFSSSSYEFSISADHGKVKNGKLIIGSISFSDGDLPETNKIEMHVVEGNENNNFFIDNDGMLYAFSEKINRIPKINNLSVLVTDGKFYSTVPVKVMNLHDKITCDTLHRVVELSEDTQLGTLITPGFEQKPKDLNFTLFEGNKQLITINANGSTSLRKSLDRENASQHSFKLFGESVDAVCMWDIFVKVTDVNDEVPKFEKPEYVLTVKENVNTSRKEHFCLEKLTAVDGDSGNNGKITYVIDENADIAIREIFNLDQHTGVLSLVKPVDREMHENFSFIVKAIDSGGKWSTATVTINVIDVNDNEPVFVSTQYNFEVSELAKSGDKIGYVRAFDKDKSDQVTYTIEDSLGTKYVHLDQSSGLLELAAPFDYELIKSLTITVTARDSGEPPLKGTCKVKIKVLDVNDNPPKFAERSYRKVISEDSPVGTKIIKMVATDLDSEPNSRISYTLSGGDGAFKIISDGWIFVARKLDREKQDGYRLQVVATDSGIPPLSGSSEVIITLDDVNDNPPTITPCNLTISVQEGAEPGYILTKVAVTDDDIPPNAGPFRLAIEGYGSDLFDFDADYNLVLKSHLSYSNKMLYLLHVIAYDQGNLSSECPLTINVKQESLHPPEVMPLKVSLNILMDEYLGGRIGTIYARDMDSDLLRYNISDDASSLFRISPETGEIFASPGLTASVYAFTVNVTNGKYTVQTNVTVDVYSITQAALDHSVSLRFINITARRFLTEMLPVFEAEFVYLGKFRLLSIQESEVDFEGERFNHDQSYVRPHFRRNRKHRRDNSRGTTTILDVLMVMANAYGYVRPERVSRAFGDFAFNHDIKVNITTEVCNSDTCVNGECIGRLYLEESAFPSYFFNNEVFSAPRHDRTFECICREGFGGSRCSVSINKCSTNPCRLPNANSDLMMCIPTETLLGYECSCPPGRKGDLCSLPSCDGRYTDCSKNAEIGVNGRSFFQMLVTSSLEESLLLSFKFRTISSDAVIMHGAGETNFHVLELQNGYISYRWDCGSGIGTVNGSGVFVSDGKWHYVEINRYGRSASLKIDSRNSFQGFSPIGGKVLNLRQDAVRLTFGGLVHLPVLENDDDFNPLPTITRGMIGCFGLITVDSDELPKTKQGLRLYNTKMGCAAMEQNPCSQKPCKNGGSCQNGGLGGYRCLCLNEYSGANCELLSPCVGDPCGGRGLCTTRGLSYFCDCSEGYTGRNCEISVLWSYCTGSMCGSFGRCVRQSNGFYYCNCSHGYSGRYCNEPPPAVFFETAPRIDWLIVTIVVGIIILIIVVMCLFCMWFIPYCLRTMKRRRNTFKSSRKSDFDPCKTPFLSSMNNNINNEPKPAPPIPPRRPIIHGQNIPTAEVRPYDKNELYIHGSRSPSIAEPSYIKPKRIHNSQQLLDKQTIRIASARQESYGLHRYGKRISEEDIRRSVSREEYEDDFSSADDSDDRPPKDLCSRRVRRHTRNKRNRLHGDRDSTPLRTEPSSCNDASMNVYQNKASVEVQRKSKHSPQNNRHSKIPNPDQATDCEYVTFLPPNKRTFASSNDTSEYLMPPDSSNESDDGAENYVYPDEVANKPPLPVHRNTLKEVALEDGNRVYDNPAPDNLTARKIVLVKACGKNDLTKKQSVSLQLPHFKKDDSTELKRAVESP